MRIFGAIFQGGEGYGFSKMPKAKENKKYGKSKLRVIKVIRDI